MFSYMQQGSTISPAAHASGSNERDQFYARHLTVAETVVACQQPQQAMGLSDEERILRSKAES